MPEKESYSTHQILMRNLKNPAKLEMQKRDKFSIFRSTPYSEGRGKFGFPHERNRFALAYSHGDKQQSYHLKIQHDKTTLLNL